MTSPIHSNVFRMSSLICLFSTLAPAPLPAQIPGAQGISMTFEGDTYGYFGASVAGGEDVNGDGVPDVVVGAPWNGAEGCRSGSVFVYSGADGSLLLRINGDQRGDQFGHTVAMMPDLDNDGSAEIVVGAPYADSATEIDSGLIRVHNGATGAAMFGQRGSASGDLLGFSIAVGDDFDGKGFPDLVAGAPGADVNGIDSGLVRIYSWDDGIDILTIAGPGASDQFGYSVACRGNLTGDLTGDVLVGAPFVGDGSTSNAGASAIIDVADLLATGTSRSGSVNYGLGGNSADDFFGRSVAVLDDLNGDGIAEIAIGSNGDDTAGAEAGAVRVFSGSDFTVLKTWLGPYPGAYLGTSVCRIGDLNGDGIGDGLAIGAHGMDEGLAESGSVILLRYSGGSVNLHRMYTGKTRMGLLGASLAPAGDINQDGRDDLIAGAPGADGRGRVRVLSGH